MKRKTRKLIKLAKKEAISVELCLNSGYKAQYLEGWELCDLDGKVLVDRKDGAMDVFLYLKFYKAKYPEGWELCDLDGKILVDRKKGATSIYLYYNGYEIRSPKGLEIYNSGGELLYLKLKEGGSYLAPDPYPKPWELMT